MAETRPSQPKLSCVRLLGLVMLGFAFLAVAVSVVLSFTGFLGYPFELFSHFQLHYLIALSLIGVFFGMLKKWKLMAICFIFGLAPALRLAPLYIPNSTGLHEKSSADTESWRLMILNVNTQHGDSDLVLQQIKKEDPDVIVLIEISAKWVYDLEELETRYPFTLLEPSYNNFGIGIYSRQPLLEPQVRRIGEAQLASLFAEIELGDQTLTLVATHPLPPIGSERTRLRNDQLRKLAKEVPQEGAVIVCGDLNTTRWSPIFGELRRTSGLNDSERGFGWQPTWPEDKWLFRIPIDHCLHSDSVHIMDRRIGSNVDSDHRPVIVDFVVQ